MKYLNIIFVLIFVFLNIIFVLIFVFLQIFPLHAQNLRVYQTNTVKSSYPLSEIREITFSKREMYIVPPIADTALVRIPLENLRFLSFKDYGDFSVVDRLNYMALQVYPNPVSYDMALQVYPNPVSYELQVTSYEGGSIEIYDVVGQCVFTSPNPSKGGEYPISFGEGAGVVIDVSHLASGMYILKITDYEKNIKIFKIIKN